ncbi:MAG: hypothetical protein CSA44_01540 [Gammaproteobacteria bacterium]|nr:MAG: hypothetical protein CSA44_01540 [Gammaproteobacteria bacterium]
MPTINLDADKTEQSAVTADKATIELPENAQQDNQHVAQTVLTYEAEHYGSTPDIRRKYDYTVRGKRYRVFASETNFQQIGTASWYGARFHGRKTANGELYNMQAMTAAHKTLPLGTKVQVTNLANGKKVIVRINDRGPFHKGRIIDLSKKAAKRLGIISSGYGKVHIKTVTQ